MGTGPVIIGDDGSPPLTLRVEDSGGLRVGRHFEFMQELLTAHGSHVIGNSTGVKFVRITQGGQPTSSQVRTSVEVWGNLNTHIKVEMLFGSVAVTVDPPLTGDFLPEWGRYKGADRTIERVVIDGIDQNFHANGTPVSIDIEL